MNGVLSDAVSLRREVAMHAVNAERPGGVAQEMAHQPPQRGDLRDAVPLDDVAKQHGVHVSLKEFDAKRARQYLRIGEPTLGEERAEALFNARALRGRPASRRPRRLLAAMTQVLAETERTDHRREPAPSERCVHLP